MRVVKVDRCIVVVMVERVIIQLLAFADQMVDKNSIMIVEKVRCSSGSKYLYILNVTVTQLGLG